MNIFRYRKCRILINTILCLFIGNIIFVNKSYSFDTIQLASEIAGSLVQLTNKKYSTIGFSRIQGDLDKETVEELIDFTENAIVQSRRFRLIDRSKLQLILNEQKFNMTGMVTQNTFKQLGKLLGIDLFIYGHYYKDTIVFKAIDVESSAIVWSNIFILTQLSKQSVTINTITKKITASINDSLGPLKASRIEQLGFWNIQNDFDQQRFTDYLSVAITRDGNFQVVDRENLQFILEEQKLNMEDFIDEKKAKRMGELFGIDAFIYGRINKKNGKYIVSFKMLNIYNGVIEWAKTLRIDDQGVSLSQAGKKIIRKAGKMAYVPYGVFLMGDNNNGGISSPQFKVPLKAFYIDRTEVSNYEYSKFVKKYRHRAPPSWIGGRIPAGNEDKPVVKVSWNDASRYCKVQGKRLPKETEWEKAFRGTTGNKYPWHGTSFYPSYSRTRESNALSPVTVDFNNKDVSVFGVQHLAGNVREWVGSYLKPYPRSRYYNKSRGLRVIRGGSWAKTKEHSTGWYRDSSNPNYGWQDVGFRCAKSSN